MKGRKWLLSQLPDSDSDAMRQLIAVLPPREMQILKMRFGICGEESHTLKQISLKLMISRERVRQIEIGALRKLRKV